MSAKQQLTQAIAALPDSISVEEAVERLYRAFKLKHGTGASEARAAASTRDPLENDPRLRAVLHEDPTAPLDPEDWPEAMR